MRSTANRDMMRFHGTGERGHCFGIGAVLGIWYLDLRASPQAALYTFAPRISSPFFPDSVIPLPGTSESPEESEELLSGLDSGLPRWSGRYYHAVLTGPRTVISPGKS
jgi:hypothetical protein